MTIVDKFSTMTAGCPKNMDKDKIWRVVLSEVELSVTRPTFVTFFGKSALLSLEGNVATIGCPSPLSCQMIETRYYSLVKSILDKHTAANNSLVFKIKKAEPSKKEELGPLFTSKEEPSLPKTLGLREDFTFENFAVSTSNQVAFAASQAVSLSLGTAYNPLFLYGGVGVGKTHLMQAIGNNLLGKKPKTKIIYCMGEDFINEIIEAIKNRTTDLFKKRFRQTQVLLLDDVQFIAGKDRVQEEFFHTFNAILRVGGQVVLTSDRPPSEIAKLEERLRSRFEGGLTVDISPPDFELRTAILLIKSRQRKIDLSIEVAKFIAANIEDTRKLEGTLLRAQTEAETKKEPLSVSLLQSILGKKEGKEEAQTKKIPAEEILKAVADYFNLKVSQIRSKKRSRPICVPRQILMYLLRGEMGLTYETVGEVLGGRDHSTIIHGVDKISHEMLINERLREDVSGIRKRVWG